MISLKGPGLRLFAAVLLVVAFLTLRERKAVRALKERRQGFATRS